MQRTVKTTKFTYAETVIDEGGNLSTTQRTVEVPETDPNKAYKAAAKIVGNFAPIITEV